VNSISSLCCFCLQTRIIHSNVNHSGDLPKCVGAFSGERWLGTVHDLVRIGDVVRPNLHLHFVLWIRPLLRHHTIFSQWRVLQQRSMLNRGRITSRVTKTTTNNVRQLGVCQKKNRNWLTARTFCRMMEGRAVSRKTPKTTSTAPNKRTLAETILCTATIF
jgi:hypothetical protein